MALYSVSIPSVHADESVASVLVKLNEQKERLQLELPLLRGDILHVAQCHVHRNVGKFIWNGRSAQNLDYRESFFADTEYGAVPLNFTIGGFPATHWAESLDRYGLFVPVNLHRHGQEMLENMEPAGTSFTAQGKTFRVLFAEREVYRDLYKYYQRRKKPFDYPALLTEKLSLPAVLRRLITAGKVIRMYARDQHTLVLFGQEEGF